MIVSKDNKKIKKYVLIKNKKPKRVGLGLMAVEGYREVCRCISAGHRCEFILVAPYVDISAAELSSVNNYIDVVSESMGDFMSVRQHSDGVFGLFYRPSLSGYKEFSKTLHHLSKGIFVVLDGVDKPGNIGAIIRSAIAFGVTGILLLNNVDVFSLNVIRNSMGAVFDMPIYYLSYHDIKACMTMSDIAVYVTYLAPASVSVYDVDLSTCNKFVFIVFGAEHDGVSSFWKRECIHVPIIIDMPGCGKYKGVDSLNVSNAAAICMSVFTRRLDDLRP